MKSNKQATKWDKVRSDIQQLRTEFERKRKELESKLLGDEIKKLTDSLSSAVQLVKETPPDVRRTILADVEVRRLVKSLSPPQTSAKNGSGVRRSKISDEDILAFLSDWRTTSEIVSHFNSNYATVGNRMRQLAGKIISDKKGRGTSYKVK